MLVTQTLSSTTLNFQKRRCTFSVPSAPCVEIEGTCSPRTNSGVPLESAEFTGGSARKLDHNLLSGDCLSDLTDIKRYVGEDHSALRIKA
jgi:hypothetical protein